MAHFVFVSVFDEAFLGLRCMGAMLKKHGHKASYITVKVFEEMFDPLREDEFEDDEYKFNLKISRTEARLFLDLLRRLKPDIVGFTTVSNYHCQNRLLTRLVKEELGVPVIWGGPDALLNPDIAIQCADMVCMGEGEHLVLELAKALENGRDYSDIDGLLWKQPNGQVVRNKPRADLKDLDTLPFMDWSLDHYYTIAENRLWEHAWHPRSGVDHRRTITMTARGCPLHCAFCYHGAPGEHGAIGNKVRRRTVDNVMKELREMKKRWPELDQIYFADEIFPLGKAWVEEFAERYREEIGIPFVCYTYPQSTSKEVIEPLVKAGLRHVMLGVQSGSDRTNKDLYDRVATHKHVLRAAQVLHESGQDYIIELIVGNPLEREEDYLETLRLLRELPRPFTLAGCYKLHFYRNYSLTLAAQKMQVELEWANPTTALAKPDPAYDFWAAIFWLMATAPFSDRCIDTFLASRDMRENPHALLEVARAFGMSIFRGDHSTTRMKKDAYIHQLQCELATLKGSRAVQLYQAVKRNVFQRKKRSPRRVSAPPA